MTASETTVDVVSNIGFSGCGNFLTTAYDMSCGGPDKPLEDILGSPRLLELRANHAATGRENARLGRQNSTSSNDIAHGKDRSSRLQVLSNSNGASIRVSGEGARTPATISLALENGTIGLTRHSHHHSAAEADNQGGEDRSDLDEEFGITIHKQEIMHLPMHLTESSNQMHVQLLMPSGGADTSTGMSLIIHEPSDFWTTLRPESQQISIPMVITMPACSYALDSGENGKQQWHLEGEIASFQHSSYDLEVESRDDVEDIQFSNHTF